MTAHLTDGTQVAIADRKYLTRSTGETVMYGVVTTEGRWVSARLVSFISL